MKTIEKKTVIEQIDNINETIQIIANRADVKDCVENSKMINIIYSLIEIRDEFLFPLLEVENEKKVTPYMLIFPKGASIKFDGLDVALMSLVAEVDGNMVRLIKNRLDSRKEMHISELPGYVSRLFEFYK